MPQSSLRSTVSGSAEHFLSRRAFFGTTGGALLGGALGLNALAAPTLANQLQRNQKRVAAGLN